MNVAAQLKRRGRLRIQDRDTFTWLTHYPVQLGAATVLLNLKHQQATLTALDQRHPESPCLNPDGDDLVGLLVYEGQIHRNEAACAFCRNQVACALNDAKGAFRFVGFREPEPEAASFELDL